MIRKPFAVTLAAAMLAGAAWAQSPAQPSATPATPAASSCPKPDPHPGRLASRERARGWDREVSAWQECMKKVVSDAQARADEAVKQANAAIAASNAAINDYNATAKEIQAQIEASK